jgi:uncharacterized protein (DUF305 family)
MPRVFSGIVAAFICVGAAASQAQQPSAQPSVVQPGAPGQATKSLPTNMPAAALVEPSKADVEFMQGMIMHHAQAVVMTKLLEERSSNTALVELGRRIDVSQTDELKWMKNWLTEHGKPISTMEDMPGMDMSSMMPDMPGMLTPAQMTALRNAREPEFDHLFLTGMIQHHTGALKMVKDLFQTPGAAQDPLLFEFTSDVTNTQQAEIDTMRKMLAKEKQ